MLPIEGLWQPATCAGWSECDQMNGCVTGTDLPSSISPGPAAVGSRTMWKIYSDILLYMCVSGSLLLLSVTLPPVRTLIICCSRWEAWSKTFCRESSQSPGPAAVGSLLLDHPPSPPWVLVPGQGTELEHFLVKPDLNSARMNHNEHLQVNTAMSQVNILISELLVVFISK